MIKGEKVKLRPVKEEDAERYVQWLNDEEVIKFLSRRFPLTIMEEKEFFNEIAKSEDSAHFAIDHLEEDKHIGHCSLRDISLVNHIAEFGILIGEPNYWKKGYGKEATELLIGYGFNTLNLHKIESAAIADNKASIALHEGVGFKEEGIQRESEFREGKYRDIILYGLLRKDWRKK